MLFDDRAEVLHDRVSVDKIKPMTEKEYYVLGGTALLDAVGGAIHHIGNVHKYAREEDRPEKTFFIIYKPVFLFLKYVFMDSGLLYTLNTININKGFRRYEI